MLVVETITRIRREHRDGKPIKAIARDLRLSRNSRDFGEFPVRDIVTARGVRALQSRR